GALPRRETHDSTFEPPQEGADIQSQQPSFEQTDLNGEGGFDKSLIQKASWSSGGDFQGTGYKVSPEGDIVDSSGKAVEGPIDVASSQSEGSGDPYGRGAGVYTSDQYGERVPLPPLRPS